MAPKRKLKEDSSESAESAAKKMKTSEEPGKASKSTQPPGYEPTEEFFEAAKKQDAKDLQPNVGQWVETMALHLAHSSQFIEWIKSPTALSQVQISYWWIIAVNLPGRWNKHKNPQVSTLLYLARAPKQR